jgi:pimeloyl-ACP methyl ester carboxylesterase
MATRPTIVLASAFLAFAAGCVSFEDSLVYHPLRCTSEEVAPEPPIRDLTLHAADGTAIHARWCPRPGSAGAIVYCHGNGGDLEIRARPVRELGKALGESLLIFDYPGYGRSGGQPSEAGCYAAADAAYDWLTKEQHIPPEQVLIFGE